MTYTTTIPVDTFKVSGYCRTYKQRTNNNNNNNNNTQEVTMDRNKILAAIQQLARSQGYYGRLLNDLTDEGLDYLEAQNFGDAVDMVMFLEG